MKKILILFFAIFLACGCATKNTTSEMEPEYIAMMESNKYIIVDVREEDEFNSGHIAGAINIPYDEIASMVVSQDEPVETLEEGTYVVQGDLDTIVFVYCQSGRRSSYAFSTLTSMGVTAYDLGAYEDIDLPKE